jgi:polyhydroxyalkanoate synthesis regulator phasin
MTQTKRDRKEKLNNLTLHSEKCKLIYEWVKTGKISLQEYSELIQELKQQEQ